jgi:hypothetical protein
MIAAVVAESPYHRAAGPHLPSGRVDSAPSKGGTIATREWSMSDVG